MVNILLACPMQDGQSGLYMHNSLTEMNHRVAYFDWRHIAESKGVQHMNSQFVEVATKLNPDIVLIVKGLGITKETIQAIKANIDTKVIGWIFDVTLGGTMVKDVAPYVDFIKSLDSSTQ